MTTEVRGDQRLIDCIFRLLASEREELLIGFAHKACSPGWLLLVDECRLARDHEVTRDVAGLHWRGELTSAIYAEASRSDRGIVLVHAHGGHDEVPRLSKTDQKTVDELLPHFGLLLPGVPHAYVVVNATHASGWVQVGDLRRPLDLLRVPACPVRRFPALQAATVTPLQRDDRQVGALGSRGVAQLRRSHIAVIGLGGAGSQVAEMLAHAGAGHLALVDADNVEDVNLSRTHGTSPKLVGTTKVAAASRMIRSISPETEVHEWVEAFPGRSLLAALRDVDIVVSCVDNVQARNELNRFALRYGIPLVDVGTTISENPFRIDGHVSLVLPGGHCLRCLGHVSDPLIEEAQEQARRGNYGISERRPQVVSFNGLLASAAVTEVLKVITGFAGAQHGSREWHYDPMAGELRVVLLPNVRCYECDWYSLKGDTA
jgi:molybdopterin/thiamine biosynthesis adenylyltransferase